MNPSYLQSGYRWLACFTLCLLSLGVEAQDLEPRRWTHMPTGVNVAGLAVGYSFGEVYFNPVLDLQDVDTDIVGGGLLYLRTFGIAGKSARVDMLLPYSSARWEGLLEGEPASTRRRGFGDPRLRLSYLVYGAPAQTLEEFMKSQHSDTVVGVAVSVKFPWGQYYEDRLLNIGSNQWRIRPQVGVTHTRNKWTFELTGSLFWYSDNDDFFGGMKLENDILWAGQGHIIYTFRPGLWASLSTAYGDGADYIVDGEYKDLKVENWLTALSFGVPINRQQGLKFSWVRTRTQRDTGADIDSLTVAWSMMF